ncbi:RIP metalloprotease RseP [Entomobacter blattae]|uniref:Zinc metalloprotease n=1 Tax=Entomobacter blattae TaxID=2762277 RepID=A0A7H1NSL0_9PROT|nr:RIP metalloprotease RseP [Entomobacter blattae]QNT78770.1 Metalloprotease MmpA [Entomobacter blattae]
MYELLRTIVAFCVVLGVLVFFHELGHYLAARWRGVHVDVFSIGFGKPILKWHDSVGTEWRLCPIPLGGYVKPHGFEGPAEADAIADDGSGSSNWMAGKAFHEKSVGSRSIIIAAGPIFNFLLAIILFTFLFAFVGKPQVNNVVSGVVAESAAAKAGIKPKDVIEKIDDHTVATFADLQRQIEISAGKTVMLEIMRDGEVITLPVVVDTVATGGGETVKGRLGVSASYGVSKPVPFYQAIWEGTKETWTISVQIVVGLWQMLTGQHSAGDLGGPLRIAQMSGQVAHYGLSSLISFIALLSVNLGLINLLPIPILDGGRLVFYCVEALIGKPVPKKIQVLGFQIGFLLIASLFVFSTFNDLLHLGLFKWLAGRS